MKSDRPKPLHRLCGKPMITYVLDSLELCQPGRAVIVVGHKAERVTQSVGREQTATPITFVEQPVQRGTGEAALIGLTGLHEDTDARAIDNFIVRLRRYLEADPAKPTLIVTVRGVGYRLQL